MNLTVSTIAKSIADYLAALPDTPFAGVAMYEDPNQQGSQPPCMFLQVRYGRLTKEMSGYWVRRLGLDLVYLLDYNLPDLQRQYQTAGEALDIALETFPYSDGAAGADPTLLRTYDREWNIDLDELHYKFELRERVTLPKPETVKMDVLELNEYMRQEASNGS